MSRLKQLLFGAAAGIATSTYIARNAPRDARADRMPGAVPPRPATVPVAVAVDVNGVATSTVVPSAPSAGAHATATTRKATLGALPGIAVAAAKEWSSRRAASKGAALALYTLLSMAPMLVLVLSIIAVFVDRDTAQRLIVDQLGALVGDQGGAVARGILSAQGQEKKGIIAGIASFVVVLAGATTAFGELKASLDELWEVKAKEGSGLWSMLRERFLSLGLLLVLALMLLSSLVVSAGLAAVTGAFGDSLGTLIGKVVAGAVTFVVLMVFFSVIFKFLPAVHLAWRDVVVGAAVTSVLFMIGKTAIGLYLGHGGASTAFGAASSLVALVVWMYYSAQIFFYGALFTHDYATTIGSRQANRVAPATRRRFASSP